MGKTEAVSRRKKRDNICINVCVNCMWKKNERQRNEETQLKVLDGEKIKRKKS